MYLELAHWMSESRVFELRHPKLGLRHNRRSRIVQHRFPIKGGLTFRETLAWHGSQPSPMWLMIHARRTGEPICET